MKIFKKITMVSILLLIMLTYIQTLVFATLVPAVESELTLTPKLQSQKQIIYTLNGQGLKIVHTRYTKKSLGVTILKQLGLLTLVIMQQMKR